MAGMKTNVLIGLVLALIIIGGVVYIVNSQEEQETITLECKLVEQPYIDVKEDGVTISTLYEFTPTSNVRSDKRISVFVPDLVLTNGERTLVVVNETGSMSMTLGKKLSIKVYNPIEWDGEGGRLDSSWTHSFELSENMKRAGNYKLVET